MNAGYVCTNSFLLEEGSALHDNCNEYFNVQKPRKFVAKQLVFAAVFLACTKIFFLASERRLFKENFKSKSILS